MPHSEPPVPRAVRAAAARLAATERWHPGDEARVAAARRDLLLAHATAKVSSAAADLLALGPEAGPR
ncbi:hypothetical protein [Serinicoccus marinus]|uniref:hypothetical protein n=1 Tax=Serinicoccus marinus TaxID=247333 RepID=UPI002491C6EC|nr:hypothetical protein [Serinicoccus marinus]